MGSYVLCVHDMPLYYKNKFPRMPGEAQPYDLCLGLSCGHGFHISTVRTAELSLYIRELGDVRILHVFYSPLKMIVVSALSALVFALCGAASPVREQDTVTSFDSAILSVVPTIASSTTAHPEEVQQITIGKTAIINGYTVTEMHNGVILVPTGNFIVPAGKILVGQTIIYPDTYSIMIDDGSTLAAEATRTITVTEEITSTVSELTITSTE